MRRRPSLPLGIDVGAARTRVALATLEADGRARLVAVASRPTGDDAAGAIRAARAELRTPERRCALALSAPDALLRSAAFPPMRRAERAAAARFEAARHVAYPIEEANVRTAGAGERAVLGIARRDAVDAALRLARHAGLRGIAVDDAALALQRAFPHADAIVDVGAVRTRLIVASHPVPAVHTFAPGGDAFTVALADALAIDAVAAERRKHSVGLAGAGERLRDELVERLAAACTEHRAKGRALREVALAGNGARLGGLAEALEQALAIPVRLAQFPAGSWTGLPPDVVRAAAPDWGLAFGLALWATAR